MVSVAEQSWSERDKDAATDRKNIDFALLHADVALVDNRPRDSHRAQNIVNVNLNVQRYFFGRVNMRPDDYVHGGIASDPEAGILSIRGVQFRGAR